MEVPAPARTVENTDSKKKNRMELKRKAPTVHQKNNKTKSECESCLVVPDVDYSLPCGHVFCRECIRGLFLAALKDKSMVPVKCCGKRIDQRLRRAVLTLDECFLFESILEEVDAPRKMYW